MADVPNEMNAVVLDDYTGPAGLRIARRAVPRPGPAPRLDRPLLFFHAGRDEVMPTPKLQADLFMEWACGEKELKYYPEAEHCTVDFLDEVFPSIVDWLRRHLDRPEDQR